MWSRLVMAGIAAVVGCTTRVCAQQAQHGESHKAAACFEPVLRCATKVTPTVGLDHAIWLAFVAANQILVAKSTDGGKSFGRPVPVTPAPSDLDWGPDARPKIAVGDDGAIFVAYAIFKDKHFNGQVLHSRSTDGGKSFARPQPITAVQESQRFEALAFDPNGQLFAAWLDKRNRSPAKARGEKYAGAALAFAWSDGRGGFADTLLAQDNTCECCRIAIGFVGVERPVVLFRNIFEGGIRDHAVITFTDAKTAGPIRRVSTDAWRTDACPHHGPSLLVAADGTYHVAWYTNGSARKGLYYARSGDRAVTFTEPMSFGSAGRSPSRPALLAVPDKLYLAWKEFDGKETTTVAMVSGDAGRNWTTPKVVARTGGDSDHPILIRLGSHAFLSWLTQEDGYRLIPLERGI